MGKKRFRNYLINKKFQLHYMLLILIFLILVSASVFASFYIGFKMVIYDEFSFNKTLSDLKNIDRIAGSEAMRLKQSRAEGTLTLEEMEKSKELIEAEKLSEKQTELFDFLLKGIAQKSFVILFFLTILITFGTLFVTHRLAGPLYRIHMLLKEIKQGNLNVTFKLRKGDQLQDLAGVLDNLFGNIRVSINALGSISSELVKKCDAALFSAKDLSVKDDILKIKEDASEIRNICAKLSKEDEK